jgi:hypothetical protein
LFREVVGSGLKQGVLYVGVRMCGEQVSHSYAAERVPVPQLFWKVTPATISAVPSFCNICSSASVRGGGGGGRERWHALVL